MEKKWVYEAIFWLLLAYLFIYAILKGIGYIKTPQIVDISPLFATGIMLAYMKLYLKQEIKSAFHESLKEFRLEFDEMTKRIDKKFEKHIKIFGKEFNEFRDRTGKEFNELRDRTLQVIAKAELLTDLMISKIER